MIGRKNIRGIKMIKSILLSLKIILKNLLRRKQKINKIDATLFNKKV